MNITREEIQAALSSGNVKWSDLAPTNYRSTLSYAQQEQYDRFNKNGESAKTLPNTKKTPAPTEGQYDNAEIARQDSVFIPSKDTIVSPESNDSIPTKSLSETLKTSEKPIAEDPKKKKYGFWDLSGNSFKGYATRDIDNRIEELNKKVSNDILPYSGVKDVLNANATNPDFYKLLREYADKKKQSVLYDPAEDDGVSLRKLDDSEVSPELVKANNDYGQSLVDWSNPNSDITPLLPNINDVINGNNIHKTSTGPDWYNNVIKKIGDDYDNIRNQKDVLKQSRDSILNADTEDIPTSKIDDTTPTPIAASFAVDSLSKNMLTSVGAKVPNEYLINNGKQIVNSISNALNSSKSRIDDGIPGEVGSADVMANARISIPFNVNKAHSSDKNGDTLHSSINNSANKVSDYVNSSAANKLKVDGNKPNLSGIAISNKTNKSKEEESKFPISDWVGDNISIGLKDALKGLSIGINALPHELKEAFHDMNRSVHSIDAANASAGFTFDNDGHIVPTFYSKDDNRTLSDIYSGMAKNSKQNRIEESKKVLDINKDMPDTWQAKAGAMTPLLGTTVGGIITGQPEITSAALTSMFIGTGYAGALNVADQYEKETGKPINDDTKSALGMGTAIIYAIPIGNLSGWMGNLIKETPLKDVAGSVFKYISKNPKVVSAAGEDVFKTFADQSKFAPLKSFSSTMAKGAVHSVLTMESIGISQNLLNEAIIGKHTTQEGWYNTFKVNLETGLAFSMVTIPFAKYKQGSLIKKQIDSNDEISLTITDKGKAVYINSPEKELDQHGNEVIYGTTPDNKRIKLTDEELGRSFTMTTKHFKDEIAAYKKSKTVDSNIEQNALKNRVFQSLNKMADEYGMIPIATNSDGSYQIITGESANGKALGLDKDGLPSYIDKDAKLSSEKIEDIFNDLIDRYYQKGKYSEKEQSENTQQKNNSNTEEFDFKNGIISTVNENPSAGVAIDGIGSDPRYSDESIHNSAMIHIDDASKAKGDIESGLHYSNAITNAAVLHDMQMNDRVDKTESYMKAVNNKSDGTTIKYLEELAKNPPQGVDADDIRNEIKIAKRTIAVAKDKEVVKYADRTGGINSENHKVLTALIVDHENSTKQYNDIRKEFDGKYISKKSEYISDEDIHKNYLPFVKEESKKSFTTGNARMLFDALHDFNSLKDINLELLGSSSHDKEKHGILDNHLNEKKWNAEKNLRDQLRINNIVDTEIGKGSPIDQILGELKLPSIDSELSQLKTISHIADLSSNYNLEMSNRLLNKHGDNKVNHAVYLDKHVDAYRTKRQNEKISQKIKETVDDINAKKEDDATVSTSYESNSSVLGSIAETIPVEEPIVELDVNEPHIDTVEHAALSMSNKMDELFAELERRDSEEIEDGVDIVDDEQGFTEIENQEIIESIGNSDSMDEIMNDEDSSAYNELLESIPGVASKTDIVHDRISRTLFGDIKNPAIKSFLMNQDAFKTGTVRFVINRTDSGKTPTYTIGSDEPTIDGLPYTGENNFDINDSNTWDNAFIKVLITYNDGKIDRTVSLNLKNPIERSRILDSNGKQKFTNDEITSLRDFRNSVLSEYSKVVKDPSLSLRIIDGLERGLCKLVLNRDSKGFSIQRGLTKIDGLLDETDFSKIGVSNLVMSYGKGERGGNMVVSLFQTMGTTVNENAGSIFMTKTDPFDTRNDRKIKLNKRKIGNDNGAADLVYRLVVDMFGSDAKQVSLDKDGKLVEISNTSPYGLTPSLVLNKIVNFGKHTKVTDKNREFLLNKQFYIQDNVLFYGANAVSLKRIDDAAKQDILKFISENLTWNVNKDDLWNSENNSDRTVSDLFPGIKAYFNREPNQSSVKLYDGMVFDKSDMDISWTAWLIKNEKITSDIGDGVFEPPFLFMTDVKAVANNADEISPIKNSTYARTDSKAVSATQSEIDTNIPTDTQSALKTPENASEIPSTIEEPTTKATDTKNVKSLDEFDDFGIHRLFKNTEQPYDIIDINSALNFIESKLGTNFDTGVLGDIIKLADGTNAMGITGRNFIHLSELAEKGSEFHEVFHRSSLLLIPRERRTKIYNDVRKDNESLKYATDSEVEEYLAEWYREYVLTNGTSKNGTLVNNMFRKIKNAYDGLSNFTNSDIDRLFKDIDSGVLKNLRPSNRNVHEFESKYKITGEDDAIVPKRFKDNNLTAVKTVEQKDEFVKSLSYSLFQISGINNVNDIPKMDFDGLKESIKATYEKELSIDPTSNRPELFKEAYDRFDDFYKPELIKFIKKIGITEYTPSKEDNSDGIISKEMESHIKPSYEISKRNNIRTEIKFFISLMPEVEIKDNTIVPKLSSISGRPVPIEFELAWNTMIYELHNEKNIDDLKSKIAFLAHEKNNPFFVMLERRLSKANDIFLTKFWKTMYSHRHDFINTVYNKNIADNENEYSRSIRNISSNIDRATRVIPIRWATELMSNNIIYSQTDNGLVFNKDNAIKLKEVYDGIAGSIHQNMTLEDANKSLDLFVTALGKMSIDVDVDAINHIIDNSYSKLDRVAAINSLIKGYKKGEVAQVFTVILPQLIKDNGSKYGIELHEITPKVLFGGEGSIRNLAEAFAKTHPNPNEVIVPGADGANLYQISSRNYTTDIINKVSKDKEYLNQLLSIPINSKSLLLSQLNSGESKGVSFGTFVKIYEEGVSDQGRDFSGMSTTEDYSMRMSNLLSSNIVLPTMADKSTYGFIFGVKLPDMVSGNQECQRMVWNQNKISYPSKVIDIFDGYYKSEFEAIKQAWQQVKDVKEDKSKLIEVYHYSGPKSKKWSNGHGNGLRFRYMDSMWIDSTTPGDEHSGYFNLNDAIESILEKRTPIVGATAAMDEAIAILDKKFFSESYENRSNIINSTITAATKAEMDLAEKLGLFGRNTISYNATMDNPEKGIKEGDTITSVKYYNLAIDMSLFNNNVTAYEKVGISKQDSSKVAITNILANTSINHIISEFETDKLISKDLAFYNNEDDKTKRLSSALSTGDALRNTYPTGHVLANEKSFNVAELNDDIIRSTEIDNIKRMSYASQVNRLLEQSGEKSIDGLLDIYNNPEKLTELKSKHKKQFELAEKIIDSQLKPYEKVNTTDATAYISTHMYRSIMTRIGDDYFTPEMDEMFKILESDDLSWFDDASKYDKLFNLTIQPLKMIYFGDSFQNGLNVPKINKMAMFILPKFMATGDLKNLYDKMSKVDTDGKRSVDALDMALFSSAVKVGNDKPISVHGTNGEPSNLKDIKIVPQSFEYLRHQLPTDPHDSNYMAIATQVQKASMANILKGKTYKNINLNGVQGATGADIISEWTNSLNELSDRGKEELEKQFGLLKDSGSSEYTFNTEKMYDFLKEEADKSGLSSDVIETLAEFDKTFPQNIPLQALVDNQFVESKLLSSILKKTIDIKTPGGMYIQMTPFGLTSKFGYENVKMINGGKKLNFLNKDGSMDVVVSINIFKDLIPKHLKSHSEKTNWLIENNIIGGSSEIGAIGYRIPTQGLSSISGFRIADVLPTFMGDIAIMPQEFTALTGSDFDVDKIFISAYNYHVKTTYNSMPEENYQRELDYKKYISTSNYSPKAKKDIIREEIPNFDDDRARVEFANKNGYYYDLENKSWASEKNDIATRVKMDDNLPNKWVDNKTEAIQNRFLDTMISIVSDSDNVNESRFPLDAATEPAKECLAIIDKYNDLDPNRYPFEKSRLSYEVRKKEEYFGGKSGLGIFALAGVHHTMTQMTNLVFKNKKIINKYKIGGLDKIYGQDGKRILDWLSAMVSAHVDVAKDPYIIRLGVNEYTGGMTTFLLRTGFGDKTFLFISQPAIKEACNQISVKGSEYLSGNRHADKSTIDKEVKNLILQYRAMAAKTARTPLDKSQLEGLYEKDSKGREIVHNEDVFDRNKLINGLSRTTKGFGYYYNQIQVLEAFKEINKISSELAELVKYSQVDTKKAGNSFESQRLFLDKVNELMNNERSSFENVKDFYNKTFIYKKLLNSAGLSKKLSEGVLFRTTTSVEKTADRILFAMGRGTLDNREMISKVNKYVDTKLKSKFFDQLAKEQGVNVPDLFFGANTMAKRLFTIQQKYPDLIKDNYFFNNITPEIYSRIEKERADQIRPKNNNTTEPGLTEKLKQHFSSALDNPNPEVSKFAKDFILYQFYSTGDNHASNTIKISEYDRRDLKIKDEDGSDIGYYKFISNELDRLNNMGNEAMSNNDIVDIFENRWYDNDIVPTKRISYSEFDPMDELSTTGWVKKFMPSLSSTKNINGMNYPLSFVDTKPRQLSYDKDSVGNKFIPYVKIQMFPEKGQPFFVLYRVYGSTKSANGKYEYPIYVAVDKKGYRKDAVSVIEHNVDKSMVKNNILPESFWGINKVSSDAYSNSMSMSPSYNEYLSRVSVVKPFEFNIDKDYDNNIDENIVTDNSRIQSFKDSAVDTEYSDVIEQKIPDYKMSEITNHSGGAVGADTAWDTIGKEYGMTNNNHYFMNNKTPNGNKQILPEDEVEGQKKVTVAARQMGRIEPTHEVRSELLIRNWSQVKYSDAIFAIGNLISKNSIMNHGKFAKIQQVSGGTGYAVQMAINENKPVYVFDQTSKLWFTFDGDKFVTCGVPKLTKNFAGIGTRELNEDGIQAIKDVYTKSSTDKVTTPNIVTVYQGRKESSMDNRDYNFYTSNKNEALDYGSNLDEKTLDVSKFLQKYELIDGQPRLSSEYLSLYNRYEKENRRPFDILNSGSAENMMYMNKFFDMVKAAGYSGYSELINGFDKSDNNYIVTFKNDIKENSSPVVQKIDDRYTKIYSTEIDGFDTNRLIEIKKVLEDKSGSTTDVENREFDLTDFNDGVEPTDSQYKYLEQNSDFLDSITNSNIVKDSESVLDTINRLLNSNYRLEDSHQLKLDFNNKEVSVNSNKEAVSEIAPNDKIIWAHPGIGKSYAKEHGADIIVLDDDYNKEHKALMELKKTGTPEEYNAALTRYWETAKADARASGKQLFVSDLPVLRKFSDDFDKIINVSNETFFARSKQRGDFEDRNVPSWKQAINEELMKLEDQDSIITTDKYLSDMLPKKEVSSQVKNTTEEISRIWDKFKDRIEKKSPVTVKEDIADLLNEMDIKDIEDYLEKCY